MLLDALLYFYIEEQADRTRLYNLQYIRLTCLYLIDSRAPKSTMLEAKFVSCDDELPGSAGQYQHVRGGARLSSESLFEGEAIWHNYGDIEG